MAKDHQELERPQRERGGRTPPAPPPPAPAAIQVTQKNPSSLTTVHSVTNPVVIPPVPSSPNAAFRFIQFAKAGEIHEFLFELRKGGKVFWIGAAVPKGTTDFTRTQIFFHPTVKQQNTIVADDKDYAEFAGNWRSNGTVTDGVSSNGIQRYVAMEGGQLAATGRLLPVLFPFTTMAALKAPGDNMFTARPVDTLNAVMAALESEVTGKTVSKGRLTKVGVTSFSSGITALRLFLSRMGTSGLVKEIVDLDSPHITTEPKTLTRFPGAASRCFTQKPSTHPEKGYVLVNAKHFENVAAFAGFLEPTRTHARIGWMMYYQAMMGSVIP